MYNDILFSGARRFAVCSVDPETGRLAEVAVVFYLDELKEVSEQTNDRVKYVGQHSVIGRVKLVKVLSRRSRRRARRTSRRRWRSWRTPTRART